MDNLVRDIRYALRQLLRSPGFAAVAILTLALGVGANAVVFSGNSSLLLHRLRIANPDRVFFLEKPGGKGDANASYPVYRDLRDRNTTFSGLIACRLNVVGVQVRGATGQASRVWMYEASGNYFSMSESNLIWDGMDHKQGAPPVLPPQREHDPEPAIAFGEARTFLLTLVD